MVDLHGTEVLRRSNADTCICKKGCALRPPIDGWYWRWSSTKQGEEEEEDQEQEQEKKRFERYYIFYIYIKKKQPEAEAEDAEYVVGGGCGSGVFVVIVVVGGGGGRTSPSWPSSPPSSPSSFCLWLWELRWDAWWHNSITIVLCGLQALCQLTFCCAVHEVCSLLESRSQIRCILELASLADRIQHDTHTNTMVRTACRASNWIFHIDSNYHVIARDMSGGLKESQQWNVWRDELKWSACFKLNTMASMAEGSSQCVSQWGSQLLSDLGNLVNCMWVRATQCCLWF